MTTAIMNELHEHPQSLIEKPQGMTRRQFIKVVITAGLLGGGISSLATGKLRTLLSLGKALATEKMPLWIESRRNSSRDVVSTNTEGKLTSFNGFLAIDLQISIHHGEASQNQELNPDEIVPAVLFLFHDDVRLSLTPAPEGQRQKLLENSAGWVGPIGPVTGDFYTRGGGDQKTVDMLYAALDSSGQHWGPEQIVDRLPGFGENLNNSSSGGLIFDEDAPFRIVDKNGLTAAKEAGTPFMQVFYTITDENEQLLDYQWEHQRVRSAIGNSSYNWSAYIEFTSSDGSTQRAAFITKGTNSRLAIWHLVKICKELTHDGKFKIALVDAGNGNTAFAKGFNDPEPIGYGYDPQTSHLSPFGVALQTD